MTFAKRNMLSKVYTYTHYYDKIAIRVTWDEKLRWEYEWNPRDQMETATKFENGINLHEGKVEYRYCLSCDGALSERIEYDTHASGAAVLSWERYEYHGLDLMRVDERYDTSGGSIDSGDPWRTLEVSSHRPGAIGSLLGKRVYTHTNNDATPDDTDDFYYTYDPVGNVVSVLDDSGNEAYHFTQEAFGNELPVNVLGGSDWDSARDDRIVEHQTGKWRDEFTGLYYFWARWYGAEVGRFVSVDPEQCRRRMDPYQIVGNTPTGNADPTGWEPLIYFPDPSSPSGASPCDPGWKRCPSDEDDPDEFNNCECDYSAIENQFFNTIKKIGAAFKCMVSGAPDSQACKALSPGGITCEQLSVNAGGVTPWRGPHAGIAYYNHKHPKIDKCGYHCVCAHESTHVRQGPPTSTDKRSNAFRELVGYGVENICLRELLNQLGGDY